MRRWSAGVALGIIAVIAAAPVRRVMADQRSPSPRIVVKAGSISVSAGDIEQRLASLPAFQRATLGRSPDEIRRNAVEKIVVPEVAFAAAASAKKLDESPALRDRIMDVLRSARLNALTAEVTASVGPDAVARYYEENRAQFDFPERISVWRILFSTREDAVRALEEVKAPRGTERWIELARERSIDKATAMRGGDLGFLSADGASSVPTVKVDPALFTAASKVKDGAVVPDPVAEGTDFAVVWRRSTMPSVHRTLAEEAPAIRQVLVRQKTEQASRDLVARLRAAKGVEVHPEIAAAVEFEPSSKASTLPRPGAVPVKPNGPAAPSATPQGLR
jgi:peptidyl-prolyl cis-trans isomerase C